MPLPVGGEIPWPPPELEPVHRKLTEWGSWYSGDPDALTGFYSIAGASNVLPARVFFSSDKAPGATGPTTPPRTFWGAPLTPGTQRNKLHVPVASDISELSANLLFGELPKFKSDDRSTQKALDAYQTDGMHAALREAAEQDSALGGIYLKIVWDKALADRPWVTSVDPENAIPEWTWDRLSAVTFWTVLHQDDEATLRLLERHEPGYITYGLYKGSVTELGERMPLSGFSGTTALAALYGDGGVQKTGIPWMTSVYVPNVRPARCWRGIQCAKNLGRSDYTGIELLMDALDETYTSWMRDLRLAKSRIMVPQSMLEIQGPGQGSRLDLDREAFIGLEGMMPPEGGTGITLNQFAIRFAEHQATADALFQQIVQSAGYSVQSFGGQGDVAAVTATEVQARKEQSLGTRDQKILYWRPALQQLLRALLGIDQQVFGHPSKQDAGITVAFPEAVQPSLGDLAATLYTLTQAHSMSLELRVQTLHPDWDNTAVQAEVARIKSDDAQGAAAFLNTIQ